MREKTVVINTEIKKFYIGRDNDNSRNSLLMYRTVHGTVCGLLEINYRNGRQCACASVKRQYSQPTGAPGHRERLRHWTGAKTYYTEGTFFMSHPRPGIAALPASAGGSVAPETPPLCFSTLSRMLLKFHIFI